MEQWEIEEAQFLQAQEEEEREQREAEELLQWHLNYSAKPKEQHDERRD